MTVGLVDEYDRMNWENGREAASRELAALCTRLMADGRQEDIFKMALDPEYRAQLYSFYFPNGIPGIPTGPPSLRASIETANHRD